MNREEIIRSIGVSKARPSGNRPNSLPRKRAFIYIRVSSKEQGRERKVSIGGIAELVVLAREDGYKTRLDPDRIGKWLESIKGGEQVSRVIEDGEVIVDYRDAGLSGSLGKNGRPGLAHLWQRVASDDIGTIYTQGLSRLSRDEMLCSELLRLLKERRCRLRTQE